MMKRSKLKNFALSTKDIVTGYQAASHLEALKLFFEDVKSGKIDYRKLGQIVNVHFEKSKKVIPFRVAPILWKLKIINTEMAVMNLIQVLGDISDIEALKLLQQLGDQDYKTLNFQEDD